jgi:hypothetical protein
MFTLSKAHTKLIHEFTESKKDDVKHTTLTSYFNNFIRLIKFVFDKNKRKNILSANQKATLLIIDNIPNISVNSKLELLKIYKYLLVFKNKTHKLVDVQINKLFNLQPAENKIKNIEIIKSTLSYDDLLNLLSELKNEQYILYYILIYFNVRNLDLIIKLVSDASIIKKADAGELDYNIIYKKDNKYIYIRSDYKTKSKYGIKIHTISDPKFIEYMADYNVGDYLFTTNQNKMRGQNQFTKYISTISKKLTTVSLNQQIIYKIISHHFEEMNDYKMMTKISSNRGHSLEMQKDYYL